MTQMSTPRTDQTEACAPDPDRAGPVMSANLAALLCVVCTLLEYGRHLAATIERRATMPGFSLFAALFGTNRLRVILAHLQRGIMRATALETLLLMRAAGARNAPPIPRHPRAPSAANTQPTDEPIAPQIERLHAERVRHDPPIDPDNLPTQQQIEAEVRALPFGQTIAGICRDFGIIPALCTDDFRDALADAIDCHHGDSTACWQDALHRSEHVRHEQQDNPETEQTNQATTLPLDHALGFKLGEPPVEPHRDVPVPPKPRPDIPCPETFAAVPPKATGPPLQELKLAA